MSEIKIANIKKKEHYTLYIGRANKWLNLPASKWGNPFILKKEVDRESILEEYRQYILNNPELMASLHELDGQILGCYCRPKRCHGNVLIELRKEQIFSG